MTTYRVCVGAWAGGMADTLKKFGVELNAEQKYPTRQMTMDEVFTLMRQFVDADIGVQLTPYIYGDSLDYVLWVDTPKGRFRHR